MANGRSNYNRYGGYGGWGSLAAGERYLQNNPQSFSQGLQIGMQYRDPRMTQKLLMAQLELAETEKEVTKNLENYFTTTDVDMNSIHENDIPVLTDYLTNMKSEWFETTKLAAESDDPVAKEMKQQLKEGAAQMGLPTDVDMNILFSQMGQMVEKMKDSLDKD